jgi:bla regulator protein blaR1
MTRASQLLLTFLANAAWQVALIAAVASGCSWLLRSTAARYRHLLWVIALSAAVVLPIATSIDFDQGYAATAEARYESLTVQIPAEQLVSKPAMVSLTNLLHVSVGETVAMMLLGLYLIIVTYRTIKLLMAWRSARRIAHGSSPATLPDEVAGIVDECRRTLGVGRFRIHQSQSVPTPVTVGVFDPIVVLSEESLSNPDSAVLRSAVGHELVHILRRDYLWNLFYEVVSIPLSFHPAMSLMKRSIGRTRELRCDEIVTERLVDAETYARALLRVASASVPASYSTRPLTVGITDADILEERVMKMLNRNRVSPWHAALLIALASLLLAIPCAAAAPMAFRISVGQQHPSSEASSPSLEAQEAQERREQEKREGELKAQRLRVEQLAEQEAKEQEMHARELEAKALKELGLTEQAKAQQERSVQEQERALKLEAEAREKAETEYLFKVAGNVKEIEEHRRLERQARAKHQAELAREAKVSMDQAIQLALNQHAGKVVECMLVKEMNEVMYRLIIVNETDPGTRVYVFLSGMDGRIVKTETER